MLNYEGVIISELQEVTSPSNNDIVVLNVGDVATRKIKYSNLVNNILTKAFSQSDWNETIPTRSSFILNKPNVYVANVYIPSLPTIL